MFYLDAHWYSAQPVAAEFKLIATHWADWVVLIDDLVVPDDPGYEYDIHDGVPLTVDQLGFGEVPGTQLFWPSARSSDETGMKRGSAILGNGLMARCLRAVAELRVEARG